MRAVSEGWLVLGLAAVVAAAPGRADAQEEEPLYEPMGEEGELLSPEDAELAAEEPIAEEPVTEEPADPAGEPERPLKVSAFVFAHEEIDERVATEIVAGLRRGIRGDDRLRWVDPTKALAAGDEEERDPAVEQAIEGVVQAFEVAVDGEWREVTRLLDDAMEDFEENLVQIPRTTLVDASMLWGAAQCMLHRQRACETAFRAVVTFREAVEWDPRLPPEVESVFETIREETLSGPRGSIRIEAFPTGAEVFVDGRFVGAAPCRAEGLLAGHHYVSLKRLGYRRQVSRVTVEADYEATESFELEQLENAPLLQEALRGAQEEMGETRVGGGMRDLWSLLFVDQLILGDLQRIGESERFGLTLYLYDLRTRHGLNRIETEVDWTTTDLPAAEALVAELYRGVDLSGRIRPVDEPLPEVPREPDPFYRTWWFWSIMGVIVVGTTIGVASVVLPQRISEGQGILSVAF